MEVCDICGKNQEMVFSVNKKCFCQECFSKETLHRRLNRNNNRLLNNSKKLRGPFYKQVTDEDIEKNFEVSNQDGELNIPLKRIRQYLLSKGERLSFVHTKHKYKIKREYTLECKVCHKVFTYEKIRAYCSERCHIKLRNQNAYEYFKKKMQTDWKFALKTRLRDNLRDALRYYSKTGKFRQHQSSHNLINYEKVIAHLGPCPGSRHEWHVDHIIPLYKFDFGVKEDIKKAFAPNNLRWLPAKENLIKGKRD
jgi:hypothetical protein